MLSEMIDKIIETAIPKKLTVGDREYFSRNLVPVLEPMPQELAITTLTGLVHFIHDFGKKDILLHVLSCSQVDVIGHLQPTFMQRKRYISAILDPVNLPFGRWVDLESFIIALQSMFVTNKSVNDILSIIGNLKDGTVKKYKDNGITQVVTAKTGVATVDEIAVPNPVSLQPYRTFNEIEQPDSQFVFRMRSAPEGGTPTCLLTEADGGKWRLDAILKIREWLTKELPEIPIIA